WPAPEQPQEPRSRPAAQRADRRHRRVGFGQVVAGVRHLVRGRPAPLRRDLLPLRPAVPRPHGQAAGRVDLGNSARYRHRPDQPGAHLALDRRHDDRAQRSPEAPVRAHSLPVTTLEVVQDRLRAGSAERGRVLESLEAALRVGRGRVNVQVVGEGDPPQPLDTWRYSSELHCAHCDLAYHTPTPSEFSFNSPLGACETCRGFGRTIGIDYGLVIPDETRSLRGGAIKPWQTKSYSECQQDLEKFAKQRGIPLDTPWRELAAEARPWVIEGEGAWTKKVWYGVKRFFAWL